MKRTRNILLTVYWTAIAIALLTVGLYETGILEEGYRACDKQTEFVVTTFMELLTLVCIPTALRLFKFAAVARRLQTDYQRLALLRLLMLAVPLVANTLLYYIYMSTPFGYLAIIILISLTFVYPSVARCIAETTTQEEDEKI